MLKNAPIIVKAYEIVFGRLHKMKHYILKKSRRAKNGLIVKTHFSYGDKNKDKTFFVIYHNQENVGLYSTIFYFLPYIDYAIRKNYIPIIDLKRAYLSSLQDEDKRGIENAWEYYYEQPIQKYTLEEVYQSRHVIMNEVFLNVNCAPLLYKVKEPEWTARFPADEQDLKYWHQIINSYIKLNKKLEERLEAEKEKIFKPGCKVLGIAVRAGLRAGAMRNEEIYNNHPKQPSCEELIDIVEKKMKEWECDYFFLSCDDREYLNQMVSYFGDKCCYFNRKRMRFFANGSPVLEPHKRMIEYEACSQREKNEEYIIEIYLLAQCNCLYSCKGGGSLFAHFVNGGRYEHIETWYNGVYAGLGKKYS